MRLSTRTHRDSSKHTTEAVCLCFCWNQAVGAKQPFITGRWCSEKFYRPCNLYLRMSLLRFCAWHVWQLPARCPWRPTPWMRLCHTRFEFASGRTQAHVQMAAMFALIMLAMWLCHARHHLPLAPHLCRWPERRQSRQTSCQCSPAVGLSQSRPQCWAARLRCAPGGRCHPPPAPPPGAW